MYYMFSITVINKLIKALTGREIDEISENIGFNKRKSGLKAVAFFKAFTIGIWNAHDITLDIIAGKCEEFQYDLKLKKQSLLNRLKLGAELMKQALGMAKNFALKNSLKNETIEVLKQFRDVLVCDSTIISLPDKLKNTYKGMGGRNSDSALKIQAVYSIINHRFRKMELTSGTSSDRKYTNTIIGMMKPLDLVIFDCGNKLKVRLIAEKLPEEVINKRRRKEINKAKRNGKMLKKYELELLSWNILITNVEQDILSSYTICELYRARWQIELIFKSWKSYFDIGKMHNVGKDYLECIIFGKLIIITLMTALFSVFNAITFKRTGRLISFMRFFKNLREKLNEISMNLNYRGARNIFEAINRVISRSMEEKRKRKTTQSKLMEHDLPLIVLQMLV